MTRLSQLASQQTCQPASQPASQSASQPASQWSQPSNQPASQPAKQPASQRASQAGSQPARQPAASQPAHRRVDDWSRHSRTASALHFMALGVTSSCSAPTRCFRFEAVSLVLNSGAQVHALRFRGGLLETKQNASLPKPFRHHVVPASGRGQRTHGGAAHHIQPAFKWVQPASPIMGNFRADSGHRRVPPHNHRTIYETAWTRKCCPSRSR